MLSFFTRAGGRMRTRGRGSNSYLGNEAPVMGIARVGTGGVARMGCWEETGVERTI